MSRPNPEDIFTPKTVVSKEMFEARNEADINGVPGLQDRLLDALRERGCQIVIYGDTGVGKSSLLKNVSELLSRSVVEVDCKSGMTMDDIISHATRQLVTYRRVRRTRASAIEAEAEVEASVPWFARLRARVLSRFEQSDDYEVIQSPAFGALLQAMSAKGRTLLVLDNFQNIDLPETRTQVAQYMETLSDAVGKGRVHADVKFVTIGIADDPRTLLGASMSYVRRAEQIGVPRMPDSEIREVLSRGFHLLELSITGDQLDHLVFFSDGFPYFAHLLGLYISTTAIRANSLAVTDEMIKAAIARAASSVAGSYEERLRLAYERSGSTQPRRQIIRILAASSGRQWSYSDVVTLWQAANPEETRTSYNFLSAALGALTNEPQGNILTTVGPTRRFVYRFEDPHIRPYVRIRENLNPL
ncbi:ATP-binding protein [Lacisediminihabitans profunda]|uniref:ATP-binding protein n=1 Tax=Lacisediminihabitans profunda TaxID=2594790 RepID=A0A5C8UI44_9MICO|nr:ATP-binding protein [Lacisediminihabitans profunda]TXN27945.1 ATP-binding protein [Lacisediminihabitans profunda]